MPSQVIHLEKVESIGSAVRIKRVNGWFRVEYAPLNRDGSFEDDEFESQGSMFKTEGEAQAYLAGTKDMPFTGAAGPDSVAHAAGVESIHLDDDHA